jgi:putative transposase
MYFETLTAHHWVDIFTKLQYIEIVIYSLQFCQREKGLKIFA